MLAGVYEVYVSVPVRIERALRGREQPVPRDTPVKRGEGSRPSWS
jgi:hypothetical protein